MRPAGLVPHQLVVRMAAVTGRALRGVRVEGEQALPVAVVEHDELRCVREALQERVVDQVGGDQLVQQRHQQRASVPGLIVIHSSAIAE